MNPALVADPMDAVSVSLLFDLNKQLHDQVNDLFAVTGLLTVAWPMTTDYPPEQEWMDKHANEHTLWATTLNLPDPGNLNQYDLRDERQFARWIDLHAQHHELISAALGLT